MNHLSIFGGYDENGTATNDLFQFSLSYDIKNNFGEIRSFGWRNSSKRDLHGTQWGRDDNLPC